MASGGSPGCHTDCVERPLAQILQGLGGLVGTHPWPFLLLPMALTTVLGVGFIRLPALESNDIEKQFTPSGGPAKAERQVLQARFATRDSERFSAARLSTEGTFASFVVVAAGLRRTLLTREAFAELLALDAAVRGLVGGERSYEQVCARSHNACSSPNPLLSAVGNDAGRIETLLPGLTFPMWEQRYFLGIYLGGVTLDPGPEGDRSRRLRAARALRLIYFLQEDDPVQRAASEAWLKIFLQRIPDDLAALKLTSLKASGEGSSVLALRFTKLELRLFHRKRKEKEEIFFRSCLYDYEVGKPDFRYPRDLRGEGPFLVAYFTSLSRQEEFEKNTEAVIPLFSITYTLTITFSILSCSRLDCVRTKVWVASFGVLSSGLAVVSSLGFLLFCGVPFVITVANAPFLILGVGVDDMFILVSCWQKTKVKDTVRDRMADTYEEAAVSVTITTLTDVLAFYIGIATSFPSVQSFCIYTGTAFIFCYIYNLTFLGAVLALNGRREESNRHWLTFQKVPSEIQDSRGSAYNMCCVGGSYDETTGAEFEHPMNDFFRNHYGPFLVRPSTKAFVVLLYLGYVASSIYGCTQVEEGIDLRNLASDHSYVVQYYDWMDEYFKEYGPRVMVIVMQSIQYWNASVRTELENCLKPMEDLPYVDKHLSESWLRIYIMLANRDSQNIEDQNSFINHLNILHQVHPDSKWDVILTGREITASRLFIQTVNIYTSIDERNLLEELRSLAADCKIPLIVFHPAFIYFDQYLVIAQNTIQNVVIAAGAMLVISLLLIPNPLCSLWVTFAIASVIVGVAGFMAFWDVNLDSISMINLVICIGFSVDFSAHVSYAFVSSEKPSMNDKAVDSLYHLGYPVVQGAFSTIVGIMVLSLAPTYIFRTFFKIMFLVILFGILHGLVFIPVFLTFFGACQRLPNQRADQYSAEET